MAIKKKIKLKEWGKSAELCSWQQVLDRHGQNVAYAALRQGTLPYVPHSLLLAGHNVKWPERLEFLMEKRYWNDSWREEINFESDEDHAKTKEAITQWLRENEPGCNSQTFTIEEFSDLRDSAMTGIPTGVDMPTAAAAPAETAIVSATERAVHPDFYGVKYDELHNTVGKTCRVPSVYGRKTKANTKLPSQRRRATHWPQL